jgi:CBS domain-containing protein
MTPSLDIISPNASTADAARKMKDLDVGAIPVCDGETLLGIIIDRDLVLRVMGIGRDPVQAKVSEAMTAGVVFCYEDEEAETAAELMAEKQIRRLPILSRNNRLVGIVSLGDLAVDGLDAETSGAVLHDVSDPSHSRR